MTTKRRQAKRVAVDERRVHGVEINRVVFHLDPHAFARGQYRPWRDPITGEESGSEQCVKCGVEITPRTASVDTDASLLVCACGHTYEARVDPCLFIEVEREERADAARAARRAA